MAWGRIFLRWNQPSIPPMERLGVRDIVTSWTTEKFSIIHKAAALGYRVYIEAGIEGAASLALPTTASDVSGIIVDPGDALPDLVSVQLRKLRAGRPGTMFLVVNTSALQPKMRGTLILNQNGILYATSPTAQPWVDTNLALVRLEQAFRPNQTPLYSFPWSLAGIAQQQGPETADYALAVAEAGAFQANLILTLHQKLETDLARNDPAGWATWDRIKPYIQFYSEQPSNRRPEADVVVAAAEDPASFEPINLLARHNIGLRVLRPEQLSQVNLRAVPVAVVLSPPSRTATQALSRFAREGGTVALVNPERTSYPWHSVNSSRTGSSISYRLGKGRIIELQEAVSDPETFAQDIRRLIDNRRIHISLWNALTTIGVLYQSSQENVVELVNYAHDPLEAQVRIKGDFASVRYETPEHGCCETLESYPENGFTEFSVPHLYISGRIRLKAANAKPAVKKH